jgi:hypothetical protein
VRLPSLNDVADASLACAGDAAVIRGPLPSSYTRRGSCRSKHGRMHPVMVGNYGQSYFVYGRINLIP